MVVPGLGRGVSALGFGCLLFVVLGSWFVRSIFVSVVVERRLWLLRFSNGRAGDACPPSGCGSPCFGGFCARRCLSAK